MALKSARASLFVGSRGIGISWAAIFPELPRQIMDMYEAVVWGCVLKYLLPGVRHHSMFVGLPTIEDRLARDDALRRRVARAG